MQQAKLDVVHMLCRMVPIRLCFPTRHTGGKEKDDMARQDILAQITQTLGSVPDWLSGLPDPQLEHQWGLIAWVLSDSALSSRDKALVAYGAAAAVH